MSIDLGLPLGCWALYVWWKEHVFGVRKKTQTHPSLWFEAWGEVSREGETKDLETLTSFLYFWVSSQSIVYPMGCDMVVSNSDQATHRPVSWGKSSAVPSSEQGKHVPWVLGIDEELWMERVCSWNMARFVHFLPQSVDLKKFLYLPTYFSQVKIFLYQIMFIPVLLKPSKDIEPHRSESREKRNIALVG